MRAHYLLIPSLVFVSAAGLACSSDDESPSSASGGAAGPSGGTPSSGGATVSQGGATGGKSSGGNAQAGGPSGAGTGGASPGSGGAKAQGGAASGGVVGGMAGGTSNGGFTAQGGSTGGTTGGVSSEGGAPGGGVAGSAGAATTGAVAPVVSGGVRWVGRVDTSKDPGQRFAWSGTGFVATVEGDTIAVKLRSEGGSDPIFFQPVIDGTPQTRVSVASGDGEKTVTLGSALGAGEHRVELYRETEGKPEYAVSSFHGFASGTVKAPPAYSGRLIEIIGDSISAGYGNLGSEQHPNGSEDPSGGCRFSTATESAYLTYGAVAARALEADASIVALSGWGVHSDNGGNTNNVLSRVYANTVGATAAPAWTFTQKPQAVVINLGTNDFSANMSLAEAPFSTAYKTLLTSVRAQNPDALILCTIGPLLYGTGLTNATAYINAVVADVTAAGDAKVKVLNFGQQDASKGTGCDWHPSAAENQRMAELLVQELRTSLGW